MKIINYIAFAATTAQLAFADPTITGVAAQQRYPWNGKVDIAYTISGDIAATAGAQGRTPSLKVEANDGTTGMSYVAASLDGDTALTDGTHNIVWDMGAEGLTIASSNVVFSVSCETTPISYSVKFNANGGSGTMPNESFTYDAAKALTANAFTRTGYTFAGWATSASGAKVYDNAQSVSNLTLTADATVNLYAKWTANAYSVKFNANGGSGSMSNESFTYDAAKALTANAFTRTDYVFAGWATSASGAKAYNDKQSVSNLTATAGSIVNLYAAWLPATYCVIDLSAGANASSYPVTYLASPPSGGFNVDAYKTTKLVLKRIEAGSFKMGGSTQTTLSKPFFIGLFEVTQKQYQLVTGSNPSTISGDKRPVDNVNYNAIRGASNGAKWPSSSAVDSWSFLGKLRAMTGLDFDLPTEAQWEYACRAGTTTSYSYGSSANGNYMWYDSNSSNESHEVGITQPNPWGLYDMHGNVSEWCLDWYKDSLSYGTDPKGSSSGTRRVVRGGSWFDFASSCTSSWRGSTGPGYEWRGGYYDDMHGFRLSRTLNQ